MRKRPPGPTTRFFAERGFWQLSPLAAGLTRQLDDLRGRLTIEAGAQGACGTYEAIVLSGLLAIWGGGPRTEPTVECGLRRLSSVLSLAWSGRTATHLRIAIERLKTTSYRATVSDEDGGRERLFSLLDEIETNAVRRRLVGLRATSGLRLNGIYPNDAALIRLSASLLVEQNDEWLVMRRYLSQESIDSLHADEALPARPADDIIKMKEEHEVAELSPA